MRRKDPNCRSAWEMAVCARLEGHPNRERWLNSMQGQMRAGWSIAARLKREGVPPGSVVVDIGCAEGGTTIALQQAGYRAIGLDASMQGLAVAPLRAREEGVESLFLRGSACALPLASSGVDAVVMENVIEHLEAWAVAAGEAARILRGRGRIILSLPNRFGLRTILSDPHFELFGLTLLPRRLASWLVTRVLKRAEVYDIYDMPSLRSVREVFRGNGVLLFLDDGLDRFMDKARDAPGTKGALLRILAHAFGASRIFRLGYRLYRRYVSEVWILVGEKRSGPS